MKIGYLLSKCIVNIFEKFVIRSEKFVTLKECIFS